ncbi:MAG TPA: hypothetical protein VEF33_06645 [Syntrophales bacterium]|nr:hypothetical protein [Syntrophales bacterium]
MKRMLSPVFTLFIFCLLLTVIPSMIYAEPDGSSVDTQPVYAEKFTVKTDFASTGEMNKTLLLKDEFTKTENLFTIDSDTSDKNHEGSWNILKYHNVKISLSHSETDQKQRGIQQIQGDDSTKVDAIKSLPNSFLNSQYRDTFQSIGKIFEPEVKLGIEF